jgi:cystathionine beta-lyase/cystathionine gamma-synthase
MSAVTQAMMSVLSQGDRVIVHRSVYFWADSFFVEELPQKFGIQYSTFLPPSAPLSTIVQACALRSAAHACDADRVLCCRCVMVDLRQLTDLERELQIAPTKAVYFEPLSNPNLDMVDVAKVPPKNRTPRCSHPVFTVAPPKVLRAHRYVAWLAPLALR